MRFIATSAAAATVNHAGGLEFPAPSAGIPVAAHITAGVIYSGYNHAEGLVLPAAVAAEQIA